MQKESSRLGQGKWPSFDDERDERLSHDPACAGIHEQTGTRSRRHVVTTLNAATKALAIEYAKAGVRINAVSPGIAKTPMQPPQAYQALAALHPLGRMGEVSDLVGAVLYLDGAAFVTGEILHVDGGQAAGHHLVQSA